MSGNGHDRTVIDIHGHLTAPPQSAAFQASLVNSRGRPAGHVRAPQLSDELLESALQPHLARLRDAGTTLQLISPRPFAMMHSVKPERVPQIWVPFLNDVIARHCQLHPEVFRGVCGLPQYRDSSPANCLDELERCVRDLGFVGCLLNPDPMEGDGPPPPGLGSEFWYPLYAKLVELGVPALIHSASCCSPRESYTLHFINEESIAILELIESRVFEDFPDLQIVVAHGGGAIPYQVGRFEAWRRRTGQPPFVDSLRRLWFDTCLYSREGLELLFKVVGPERVLFGTEMPGTGSAKDPQTGVFMDDLRPVIEGLDVLDERGRRMVLADNARSLYRLGEGVAAPVPAGAGG